jgi:hypothetical protein
LPFGSVRLVSAGVFNSTFHVDQASMTRAKVGRVGVCEGGWSIEGDSKLQMTDLMFVGVLFHTTPSFDVKHLRRQRRVERDTSTTKP